MAVGREVLRKCIDICWNIILLACVPQFDTMHQTRVWVQKIENYARFWHWILVLYKNLCYVLVSTRLKRVLTRAIIIYIGRKE